MFKRTKICTGVIVALGGTLAAASLPALAQNAERVEITGSRIKAIGNTSSSPVSSVGRIDIETTQPVAVEELVRGLSSSYPALGPGINNGSTGIASVDLRGMGANRTLVLINSKRFVPSNLGGVVDTNNVPVSLLDRVDLVTGGASAVYGADAVAGVVNFVTKRNFSGIEARTLYAVTGENDAKRYANDLTIGSNLADGKGNVAVHIGTTRTQALNLRDRDYANTVISSATGRPGGFSDTAVPAQYVFGGTRTGLAGNQVVDATTGLLRAASGPNPPDGYNTNPPNYFETPLTRTQLTGLARYSINDNVEVYSEVFATRSNVTLNLAPSGTFGASLDVPIGNPYITPALRTQICAAYSFTTAECVAGAGGTRTFTASIRRRFVEAGPRVYSFDNSVAQYTFGLRGTVPLLDSWGYDAYYQKGRAEQRSTTQNGFSLSKLRNAINATNATTCATGGSSCVPLNVFGGEGTITPAMLNYLAIPTFQTTEVRQEVLAANANGEVKLAKSPFARSPLSVAVGLEQREVFGGNKSDSVVQTQGELLGSGAPTPDREGVIKFSEYYFEGSLPLAQNLPFVNSLTLGGGYRGTELKTAVGGTQKYGSWKQGLDFSPIKGLRFRGELQRATRAPNVNELYAPVVTGLGTLAVDPCQGNLIGTGPTTGLTAQQIAERTAMTALCQATGVTAAQVGTVPAPASSQINVTSGGNPALGPERADTTTYGFVWEPSFVPALSLTMDYWKIKIKGAVATPVANEVMQGCYNSAQNPGLGFNAFCGAIERSPLSGGLNGTGFKGVSVQSANLGRYEYDGLDIGASYRLPLAKIGLPNAGRVDMTFTGTYMFNADVQNLPTLPTVEQAGFYGTIVGTPYSRIRFTQRSTWTMGDFSAGYNWRFIGGTEVQRSSQIANTYLDEYEKIKGVHYVDLTGSWQVLKNLKLGLTINNAFDKKPPFTGTGVAGGAVNYGNTFPTVYDVIGRRFTFTATATF